MRKFLFFVRCELKDLWHDFVKLVRADFVGSTRITHTFSFLVFAAVLLYPRSGVWYKVGAFVFWVVSFVRWKYSMTDWQREWKEREG